MHPLQWEKCKAAFEWDGSLRDIYLLSTTIEDWRKLLATLQYSYELNFFIDGEKQAVLPSPEEIHGLRNDAAPQLRVEVDGITVVCHFFCIVEIEFDIDPREVTCQEKLDALLNFMSCIGNSICKDVLLTPENELREPCVVYNHRTEEFQFMEMKP